MKRSHDPYLRRTADITPRPGMTVEDEASVSPGPSIPRVREIGGKESWATSPRDPAEILAGGVPVVLGRDGLARHAGGDPEGRFLGFGVKNVGSGMVAIQSSGRFVLRVEDAPEDPAGAVVFVGGPNRFSCRRIGPQIGRIRYSERPGWFSVAFAPGGEVHPKEFREESASRAKV